DPGDALGQLDALGFTAVLAGGLAAGLLDEELAHGLGRRPEKKAPPLPTRDSDAHPPHVSLVYQCRRLRGLRPPPLAHPRPRAVAARGPGSAWPPGSGSAAAARGSSALPWSSATAWPPARPSGSPAWRDRRWSAGSGRCPPRPKKMCQHVSSAAPFSDDVVE